MQDLDDALAQISQIRHQIARTAVFRGYGPMAVASTGGLAIVAAGFQARWMPQPIDEPASYLAVWIATALVSAAVIGIEMVARSRRMHSGLADEMLWMAAEQCLPSIAAGVLVTTVFALWIPESLWMLPGLWQVLVSLGIFASLRLLPPAIFWVALWYLATGIACLVAARGDLALAPWTMGLPFGAGQFLGGAILARSSPPLEAHDARID